VATLVRQGGNFGSEWWQLWSGARNSALKNPFPGHMIKQGVLNLLR